MAVGTALLQGDGKGDGKGDVTANGP